jgi:alpha-tubulin suppressor-like RCC1 family protein
VAATAWKRCALWVTTMLVAVSATLVGAPTAEALPAPEPPQERTFFTPLVPVRVLDTRPSEPTIDGVGRPGRPLAASSSLSVAVVGRGGVPSSGVSAVVLNVTATNATTTSFLTVWPTGTKRPTASNLNFIAGQTVPNLVVAKVGAGGRIDIYNHAGSVDVLADVAGYFPDTDDFVPLVPVRLVDTRPNEPTLDGLAGARNPIGAGKFIDVTVVGRGGVPRTGVDSVVLNVTATNPTVASFLTVFPTGSKRPTASNVNMVAGVTAPNLVVAKVGLRGSVSIYNHSGTSDVIADVAGYFPTGGTFVSVPPARIYETRPGEPVVAGGTHADFALYDFDDVDVDVAGIAGVPAEFISAVVLNVTTVNPSSNSFVSVFPTGSRLPAASNLNMTAGASPRPNLVVAKVGAGGKVTIHNHSGSTDIVVDIAGYFFAEYGGIRDIDLSDRSSCALFSVGSLTCWGDTGQNPTDVYDSSPVRLHPYDLNTFDDAVDLTIDVVHSCVLRADGTVWCWSRYNAFNTAGPAPEYPVWPAQQIALPRRAVEIDDGYLQTCALLDDGTVWCWGKDFTGAARPTPWRVANIANAVQVDVGDTHGCALRSDDRVACWGVLNEYGTLGNGTGSDSPTSAVLVSGLTDADSISIQSLRSCATQRTGGAVCWGSTMTGPTGFSMTPTAITTMTDGITAPSDDIWQVVGGDDYICALRFDDAVYCYGSEYQAQFGLAVGGIAAPQSLTTPVPGLPPIAFVVAERFHMCAVGFDDEVFCWGQNASGQLGSGSREHSADPVPVISFE